MHGGTGEIYRRIAKYFPDKVKTGKKLVEIDPRVSAISFEDGTGDTYDLLISTAPLDLVVQKMMKPADGKLVDASAGLVHNNLLVVGVGLKKKIETGRCWIYFTDADMPCYRATYFSHYSPNNVPNGDTEHYSSLMCEISFRVGETPDPEKVLDQVITGLIKAKMLEEDGPRAALSRAIIASWDTPIRFRRSAATRLWPCCNRLCLSREFILADALARGAMKSATWITR